MIAYLYFLIEILELDDSNEYVFEICGSYRREKLFSNDVDVLISKKGSKNKKTKSEKHLDRFIRKLKSKMKKNNDKPLLLDDMTDKKISTKYMGFSKLKNNPVRRRGEEKRRCRQLKVTS